MVYVEQDGRNFYMFREHGEDYEVWTAVDNRRGDTIENAVAWREAFVKAHEGLDYQFR